MTYEITYTTFSVRIPLLLQLVYEFQQTNTKIDDDKKGHRHSVFCLILTRLTMSNNLPVDVDKTA